MRSAALPRSSGQATAELVSLIMLVAAFAAALGLVARSGLPDAVAAAVSRLVAGADDRPTGFDGASRLSRRLVASALAGGADAPTLADARIMLARDIGAERAGAAIAELARARFARASITALHLDPRLVRAVHVGVRAADDPRVVGVVDDARRTNAALQVAGDVAMGAAGAISTPLSVATAVGGATVAGLARRPATGVPFGREAGDVTICVDADLTWPVLARVAPRALPPGRLASLAQTMPGSVDVTGTVVVRAGRLESPRIVLGRGCR